MYYNKIKSHANNLKIGTDNINCPKYMKNRLKSVDRQQEHIIMHWTISTIQKREK